MFHLYHIELSSNMEPLTFPSQKKLFGLLFFFFSNETGVIICNSLYSFNLIFLVLTFYQFEWSIENLPLFPLHQPPFTSDGVTLFASTNIIFKNPRREEKSIVFIHIFTLSIVLFSLLMFQDSFILSYFCLNNFF